MSPKTRYATRYAPPPSPALVCRTASLTRQEYVTDADLNEIMRKYQDGVAPIPSGSRLPMWDDYSHVPDYQESMQLIIDAQDRFAALPATVRERFGNDPGQLLDFLADESNRDEAVKLGLLAKSEITPPPHDNGSQPPKPTDDNSDDSHKE